MTQLYIESFLIETLTEQVKERVRRIVKKVRDFVSCRQLEINFSVEPEKGLYEYFYQLDRSTGIMRKVRREIILKSEKTGVVGSPVKMRKIKKDNDYLPSIL